MPSRSRLPRQRRFRPDFRLLAAGLAAAAVLAVMALNADRAAALASHWRLLPEPPGLTELSFARASTLPSVYRPYRQEAVAFRVRNLERRTMSYPYLARFESMDGSRLIDAGTLVIEADGVVAKDVFYTVGDETGRVRLVIELPEQRQSIHLWLVPSGRVRSGGVSPAPDVFPVSSAPPLSRPYPPRPHYYPLT